MYAEDAREMVIRIIEQTRDRGEEVDLQDGFDLYKQLSAVRQLFISAMPEYVFMQKASSER